MIKPETLLLCSEDLEKELNEQDFSVIEKVRVSHMGELSVALYQDDSKETSELYEALFNQLFGEYANFGEVWYLKGGVEIGRIETYELLYSIKKDFRQKHWKRFGAKLYVSNETTSMKYGYSFFHVSDANSEEIIRESEIVANHIKNYKVEVK